ncbi:MAG: hypothetical protein KJ906_02430 [Nanoarchaeota archaeon]|nr:hypothetical protein [Nanoarchaeota archaeon]
MNQDNTIWGKKITIGGSGAPDNGDIIQYNVTGFLVVVKNVSGNGTITIVGGKHNPYDNSFAGIELETYDPKHAEHVIREYYKNDQFLSNATIKHPTE